MSKWVIYCQVNFLFAQETTGKMAVKLSLLIRDHVVFYGCQTLGFYRGGKGILRENHNDPRKLNDSALICAFIMFNLSVSFERIDHGTLKTSEIFL